VAYGDRLTKGRLGAALRGLGPATRAALAAARARFDERTPTPQGPYVQGVSATSATIAWVGEAPSASRVGYGRTPELGRTASDLRPDRRHAVALSDLAPGSTYHYRVEDNGGSPATGSFRTAPANEESGFAFAVIGDSGDGGITQMAVAGLLERAMPDLILHTGDVVYPSGKQRHYDRRFFAPYRRLIRGVPIFPVLGNHDVKTRDGAAYLKNFHLPFDDPRSGGRYYSFDWGSVHFVALDSELYHGDSGGDKTEQKAWLERDLSATALSRKVVFLHRPPYSSSRHGGDRKVCRDLEPVFVRHGVDLVFSGHDHCYERTVPIEGVTYVVSGGGGKRLYPAGESAWTARSASAHHAVFVHAEGQRLVLEALEPDGNVLDGFESDRR
jgi:acid phosphatase type 7